MELFRDFFFCKIHKKTPVPESLLNKVAGLYPATSQKERTSTLVFSNEFWEILTPGDCFCSTEKYFTNKTVKNYLREEKNGNSL